MNIKIRWGIVILAILLNIYNYYTSPQRYSAKPNCLFGLKTINITCNKLFYYLIISIFILDLLFILYLNDVISPPLEMLPKQWWLVIVIMIGLFLHSLYENTKYINGDCNSKDRIKCTENTDCDFNDERSICFTKFVLKPSNILKKIYKNIINIIVILLYLFSFGYEYMNNHVEKEDENPLNKFFLNRFGGFTNNKKGFIFGWSRIISIILLFINYNIDNGYFSCKYNLPINWDSK